MSTQNLISASIPATVKTTLLGMGAQIRQLLPFLLAKTPADRQKGFKLGDGTLPFLQKALNYANQNPQMVPNYVLVPEWTKDTALATDLDQVLQSIEPVIQNINDTYQEAGVEALGSALAFYNAVKLAAANNVPGAQAIYDDLSSQFPGRAKKISAATIKQN
jgi:hypothetical protein